MKSNYRFDNRLTGSAIAALPVLLPGGKNKQVKPAKPKSRYYRRSKRKSPILIHPVWYMPAICLLLKHFFDNHLKAKPCEYLNCDKKMTFL